MAILIVGLLGVAAWSVYAGRKIVGELALSQQAAALDNKYSRPDEAVPAASAALDPSWKGVAQKLEQRLRRLEQAQGMPQSVAREASSSVALMVGEYIWTCDMRVWTNPAQRCAIPAGERSSRSMPKDRSLCASSPGLRSCLRRERY